MRHTIDQDICDQEDQHGKSNQFFCLHFYSFYLLFLQTVPHFSGLCSYLFLLSHFLFFYSRRSFLFITSSLLSYIHHLICIDSALLSPSQTGTMKSGVFSHNSPPAFLGFSHFTSHKKWDVSRETFSHLKHPAEFNLIKLCFSQTNKFHS